MLTKKLLLALIFAGGAAAVLFDSPNLDIPLLRQLGVASFVLGFLLTPFYHVFIPQKGKESSRLPGVLAALGSLLVAVAVVTYLMVLHGTVICSGEGFDCLGPFFFVTIPSAVLGALTLVVSIIVHK
jgi:predicted ABC-type sugar transport system permease subunit